jgi:hypothetical protein
MLMALPVMVRAWSDAANTARFPTPARYWAAGTGFSISIA